MLQVNITENEWTVLLSENDWNLIACGLLTNQIIKTKANIQGGDVIYWACTEGDIFLSQHPHFAPRPTSPEKSRIVGKIKHIKTAASVVWRGSTNVANPIKRGWVSIDFITGETTGTDQQELEAAAPALQAKLNDNPSALKSAKVLDGAAPQMQVVKSSKTK